MSIQQNVNQLLAMTGTAMMLSPGLRQKQEDRKISRQLDKESDVLTARQEALNKTYKEHSEQVQTSIQEIAKGFEENASTEDLQKMLDRFASAWDPDNEDYKKYTEYSTSEQADIDKKKGEILKKRFELDPSDENALKLENYRRTQAGLEPLRKEEEGEYFRVKKGPSEQQKTDYQRAIMGASKAEVARRKQEEAMQNMRSGGQAMLEQKNAFRDLITQVGGKNE